jgi:hypothetical protein
LKRLARWLLTADDRLDGNGLELTHESLSIMLGVRRAGVSAALKRLQEKGLIFSGFKTIKLQSRKKLLAMASGIYGEAESEQQRLTGRSAQSRPDPARGIINK